VGGNRSDGLILFLSKLGDVSVQFTAPDPVSIQMPWLFQNFMDIKKLLLLGGLTSGC
jgi:hypothetical protein